MRIYPTFLALAVCLSATAAAAQSPDVGHGLYNQYCMACHGEGGAGDGPVREYLTIPPADLTALTAANDGVFPMLKVLHVIDGRTGVRGHVTQMPMFGEVFTAEHGSPDPRELQGILETRGRILSIAMYIETLQK